MTKSHSKALCPTYSSLDLHYSFVIGHSRSSFLPKISRFFSIDGRKDQVEFFGFLPKWTCIGLQGFLGDDDHTQPMLTFPGLLFASANLAAKLFLRYGII